MQGHPQTEETRKKISEGLKRIYATGERIVSEEQRRKTSEANKGRHHTEESNKKNRDAHLGISRDPDLMKRLHENNRGKKRSPEHIAKVIKANLGRKATDETKQKLRESHLGYIFPESQRINHLESLLGGFWYGAVRYYDIKYCELWNEEFRERVRAFFDYQCIECGTPQNGKRLGVHHVHYDKKTCCRSGEDIGSRRFVPLCKPCHGKSGHNRPYWEQHFTDIINNYYEGKCYFTKDEMKAFNTTKMEV